MPSALLIVGCVLGYLLVGVGIARLLVWKFDFLRIDGSEYDDTAETVAVIILWGILLPLVLVGGFFYGFYRLVAMPPLRVRREKRHARLTSEIQRLERELGMPGSDR